MHHVLNAFYQRAWLLEANAHATIERILTDRAQGVRPTEAELEAWEASSPYGAARNGQTRQGSDVAILPVHGIMLTNANDMQRLSGATDTRDLATAICAAADDPSVREIILDIDSPGGEVTAVDAPSAAIEYAKERKTVTAVTSGMMASAAYWIASQADRIVASPNAMVGSISVIYTHVDRSARNEREGVKVSYLTTGDKKALGNPDEPLSDEARSDVTRVITASHQAFVDAVATGRGLEPDWVKANWADDRVEIRTTAQQISMVDDIGTLHDVLTSIQTEVNQTATIARGSRADRSHVVKLSGVATILRDGPRIGAETDDPEGNRRIVITDTLANQMVDSLKEAGHELERAKSEAETGRAEATATRRRDMAARAIVSANLPPVSVERDAAFAVEVANAAVRADTGEQA